MAVILRYKRGNVLASEIKDDISRCFGEVETSRFKKL